MPEWPPEPGDAGEHPANGRYLFPDGLPAWREWLSVHHASERRVLLVLPRPQSGLAGIALAEAADEALCWGWIDSRPAALDALRWALEMAPRPARIPWSEPLRKRAESLVASGRMTAVGLAGIEAARRDGSWTGVAASEAHSLPVDLLRPLTNDPAAAAGWAAWPEQTRRTLLHWVQDSARQSVRADRVRRLVAGAKTGRPPFGG
jgi:uncharacterized protein YdeI (YjbR/CyaY-like superfamily)